MPNGFHEVRFPLAVALGGSGGPERKTEIVTTGSGREERIARWAHAKRKYDAGTGVKTIAALAEIVTFFEERRGRLFGFRWRDRLDWKSCAVTAQVLASPGLGSALVQKSWLLSSLSTPSSLREMVKPSSARMAIVTVPASSCRASSGMSLAPP